MTIFDRIWRGAADAFSKTTGEAAPLHPYSRTWVTILERADHAIWLWNDKYGPLNSSQRDYAGDLICHALVKAGKQSNVGDRYAYFHTELTSLLNHERVHAGFEKRADTLPEHVELGLNRLFQGVTA